MAIGVAVVVLTALLMVTMPWMWADVRFGYVFNPGKAVITSAGFAGMLVGLAWMWRIYSRGTDA